MKSPNQALQRARAGVAELKVVRGFLIPSTVI